MFFQNKSIGTVSLFMTENYLRQLIDVISFGFMLLWQLAISVHVLFYKLSTRSEKKGYLLTVEFSKKEKTII